LVVKAVWKLAYKQVLVSICQRSIASKALKGFCWFLFIFNGTLLTSIFKFENKVLSLQPNNIVRNKYEQIKIYL
jgi:hypothetical protein